MIKQFIFTVGLLSVASGNLMAANDYFTHEYGINQRSSKLEESSVLPNGFETLHLTTTNPTAPTTAYGFKGWSPLTKSPVKNNESKGEKMDSIVNICLNGDLLNKQVFTFTEDGKPSRCDNYVPNSDGSDFELFGYYSYEYDEMGRLIVAENMGSIYESVKYVYTYPGSSDIYNKQTVYLLDENHEWFPYQKAEYDADSRGNITKEAYFQWDTSYSDGWMPLAKDEATYDEIDRITSYFAYTWDTMTNTWVGNQYTAASYVYTQSGNDAEVIQYYWENDDWLKYYRRINTYNTSDLLISIEHLYWNREKQDWSGDDTYFWGNVLKNSYQVNEYDEYGRLVLTNVYNYKNNEYEIYWRDIREYNNIENDETETIKITGYVTPSTDEFAPSSKEITHKNKFGSETFYMKYRISNGQETPTEEEYRYMDEYNWFLGSDYYLYPTGEKRPSAKERFYYPEDFNPELPYETPSEGWHWVGNPASEDGWKLSHIDTFTWGPRDVMIGHINYDYLMSEGCRTQGFETEYDFTADTSKIIFWPDANRTRQFLENKTLSSTTYVNYQYYQGVDEWNEFMSYTTYYYYSPLGMTEIKNNTLSQNVVEVARFDISGLKVSKDYKGLVIVKYSDGSYKKIVEG